MRNGIIADTMRKAGAPYRIIFGLNLPQLVEIARDFGPDADLARRLRDNVSTRESLLIAPMLMPREELHEEEALEWLRGAPTVEVIDVLCHRLLRHEPYAWSLVERLKDSPVDMERYGALRLMWNLLSSHTAMIRPLAEAEAARGCPLTQRVALQLVDEIDFLLGA